MEHGTIAASMVRPEFVKFKTADKLLLPGLFYEAPRAQKVAIHLHGNGSSSVFYDEHESGVIAEALNKRSISFFPFNNRGAHFIKKLNRERNGEVERKRYGMAYERIKECCEDIDGAIEFVEKRGYREFYLIGVSTGANKICVYDHYRRSNKVSRYILLAGGDDTGIYYNLLGKQKFFKLLKEAQRKIKQRKGEELICELLPEEIFSYGSFYDIANPDGDYNIFPFYEVIHAVKLSSKPLFRYFKSINKPTLIVYGEKDEYAWGDVARVVNILKQYQPSFTYKIVKGADHDFHKHEKNLARTIADWL